MLAEKWSTFGAAEAARRTRLGFFARSLNHTLGSLLARRAAWGRTDPASVIMLGASTPIRGCARFRAPISAFEAVEAAAGGDSGNVTTNELRWRQYPYFNQVAHTLVTAAGASFLDVAAPSAQRPDGAMGRCVLPAVASCCCCRELLLLSCGAVVPLSLLVATQVLAGRHAETARLRPLLPPWRCRRVASARSQTCRTPPLRESGLALC